MTKAFECDSCHVHTKYGLEFEFMGFTFSDDRTMDYWKGHLCYECVYEMRKRINITGAHKIDI